MSTIFPLSASVGQIFEGYEFNGTTWNIIGVDLTANYPEITNGKISISVIPDEFATNNDINSLSATYLTQASASTNYATKEYAPNTTINNLRVYIKGLSGTVVCPRNSGYGLENFFLTVQEIVQ